MEGIMKEIKAQLYTSKDGFEEELIVLFAEAVRQTQLAYAPYSKFRVGAAVLDTEGNVYGGSNQENASYPLCMCAERVALYHCISARPEIIVKAIAITVRSDKKTLNDFVSPCGACRQVLLEYEKRFGVPMKLYLLHENGSIMALDSVSLLLPFGFDGSAL